MERAACEPLRDHLYGHDTEPRLRSDDVVLLLIRLRAGRRAALLAQVFVEIASGQHKKQSLTSGCCDSASRAVEQRGVEGSELVWLFR